MMRARDARLPPQPERVRTSRPHRPSRLERGTNMKSHLLSARGRKTLLGLAALAAVAAFTSSVANPQPAVAALNSGYHVAFLAGAGCVVLGAVITATLLRLPKDAEPEYAREER